MSIYKLAVIIKNPLNKEEFLLVKQIRPRKFGIEEYDSYIDSDLWDFPSVQLSILQGESEIQVEGAESCSAKLDLKKFDLDLALNQVSEQVGIEKLVEGQWKFWKFVEEPEFGPGPPIQTVFITGYYGVDDKSCDVACQWMSWSNCSKWLSEVTQDSYRMGPLVVNGFLHDSKYSKWHVPRNLNYQEYPLGVRLVPMESRTGKPFSTTNLLVIAPQIVANGESGKDFIAHGDALIIDPGCKSRLHQQLADIIAALPRKLVVFVTHHHPDHVDGLSAIQKCNPDAILLAHENTMHRIGKGMKLMLILCGLVLKCSLKTRRLGLSKILGSTTLSAHLVNTVLERGFCFSFTVSNIYIILFVYAYLAGCKNVLTAIQVYLVVSCFKIILEKYSVSGIDLDLFSLAPATSVQSFTGVTYDWSLGYTSVAGGEEINIGGQRLQVIFAPGHTDGHMALLHINTHSLIVGDHCVGQGSAVLDAFSGGNMGEYFNTTYKFLELCPNTLIPMHGRVNLWPKHMLCRYLKNRRDRESSILSAIENGSTTLFDIVSTIYKDVDRVLWFVAASNVRLHVEHLAQQHKLPEGMSLTKFRRTFGLHFAINWIWAYTCNCISSKVMKIRRPKLIVSAVVACFAALYCSLGSLSMVTSGNSSFLEDFTPIQNSLASGIELSDYGSETLVIG
uniref:Metallo-beta-lactamase domain-containing protein n=1 Tax=Chenopodium quinoa TaxID=63459 RepID=A0A803MYM1_CHEQI